jgi:hypothetical protein
MFYGRAGILFVKSGINITHKTLWKDVQFKQLTNDTTWQKNEFGSYFVHVHVNCCGSINGVSDINDSVMGNTSLGSEQYIVLAYNI